MPKIVWARSGPQLRSPIGGYFVAATNARASATVLIIGAMIASAPMSSARLTMPLSPTGTRTSAGLPASAIAADRAHDRDGIVQAVLHVERDAIEAAARRQARQPAAPVSCSRPCRDRSRRLSAGRQATARPSIFPPTVQLQRCLVADLVDRRRHQLVHRAADLMVGLLRRRRHRNRLRTLRNTSSSPASSKSAATTVLA